MIAAAPLKVSGQRVARSAGCSQRLVLSSRRPSMVSRVSENETPTTSSFDENAIPAPGMGASSAVATSPVLGTVQEAINGRAAMLGFVSAVAAEAITHHSVMSQLGGKYVNLELVEKPLGLSPLLYFAIIALVTVGSIAPKLLEGLEPSARSFGPFTPDRELMLGRVAMLGFFGLIVVETVKGSSLL